MKEEECTLEAIQVHSEMDLDLQYNYIIVDPDNVPLSIIYCQRHAVSVYTNILNMCTQQHK